MRWLIIPHVSVVYCKEIIRENLKIIELRDTGNYCKMNIINVWNLILEYYTGEHFVCMDLGLVL